MNIGILINTGNEFNASLKLAYLKNCIHSIRNRQQMAEVTVRVLCTEEGGAAEALKAALEEEVFVCKSIASGINESIKTMPCSHFLIARYDTVFSPDCFDALYSANVKTGALFNACSKNTADQPFLPLFDTVSVKANMEKPYVYTLLFDKQTVTENALFFDGFKLQDQYLFLTGYFACCGKIRSVNKVLICIDRQLTPKVKFTDDFYRNYFERMYGYTKRLKKAGKVQLLSFIIKDFGVPMVLRGYKESGDSGRFYKKYAKKFFKLVNTF